MVYIYQYVEWYQNYGWIIVFLGFMCNQHMFGWDQLLIE